MNIEQYITRNEAWDISRQEDTDFIYFYLHGTVVISWEEIRELTQYLAFAGISLRDNYLCICVLKSAL